MSGRNKDDEEERTLAAETSEKVSAHLSAIGHRNTTVFVPNPTESDRTTRKQRQETHHHFIGQELSRPQ